MRSAGWLAAIWMMGGFAAGSFIAADRAAAQDEVEVRAKPPSFRASDTSFIFFNDVFAEALQGERPASLSENRQAAPAMAGGSAGAAAPAPGGQPAADASSGGGDWAGIISPTTLQDEVKRLNTQIADVVQNVRVFNGGGFEAARRDFTELALLFEIIAKHPGDVRWKDFALTARDNFAQAASQTKVGTEQSFKPAKLRSDDLNQLVRGGSIQPGPTPPEAEVTWDQIADRPPLMQRLDIAFHQRVKKMTASDAEFKSNPEEILHEAEIIAAIGHAMQQEGFEYWDDEDYVSYSQQMQQAALDIVKAVKDNNYEAARAATGEIDKACSTCHEGYR